MMRQIAAAILLFLATCALWELSAKRPAHTTGRPAATRPPYDPTLIHKTVAFYEERARHDPQGAITLAQLAGWYLQRCRETGDLADALRAERAARCSLTIRTRCNNAAYDQLAQSLATQHRFRDALAAAESAARIDPWDPQARRLRAELRIEMGDYGGAARVMRENATRTEDLSSKTLRARLLEIHGQPKRALALMRGAQAKADLNRDLPHENVAWFHMRVGDLLAGMGRAREAEQAYQEALTIFPGDHKTMLSLAKLSAGKRDWLSAITWARKAAEVVPTPEVLALAGDAYAALGQNSEAERQYRMVEAIGKIGRSQGVVYDRQRAVFLADHNRSLDEALALARREIKERKDIHAYDTLAWVCLKKGLLREAELAMQRALVYGTKDARLQYHASEIARARRDVQRADELLRRSQSINPYCWTGDITVPTG